MLNQHRGLRPAIFAVARMAWMTTCSALLAGSAVAQVHVTSLQGTVTAGGSPLSLHAEVGDQSLKIATGARCSLLLADRGLVRICGLAVVSFSQAHNGSPDGVELNVGELKATARDDAPISVRTPIASIVLRGATAHISVAPDSGDTVISALDGQVSVSRRDETDATLVSAGQQLIIQRGREPGDLRTVSRASLARHSACVNEGTEHAAALRAERALLIAGVPAVSAGTDDATGHPTSDLQQIVSADFPDGGLPLEDSSTPSALVTELGKRGMDEEICDPITCNPTYRLEQPGQCGIPPVRGCIP